MTYLDAIDWLIERDNDTSDVQFTTGEPNEHSRAVEYANGTNLPTWWNSR